MMELTMKRITILLGAALPLGMAQAATTPDLSGFWQPSATVTTLRTATGEAPPLAPAAKKLYDQRVAAAARGDHSYDNELGCRPPGLPRLMAESAFEIGQTPRDIVFLYQWNRLQRPIAMRSKHDDFDHAYPYYLGHPIGTWQGDTLVIDSIYFNTDTVLDASGLPHSDALHVVEHLKLKDASTLEDTVTIEDPKTFTQSWQTVLTYQRMSADARLPEDVCVQRLGLKDLNTNKNHVPTGSKTKSSAK